MKSTENKKSNENNKENNKDIKKIKKKNISILNYMENPFYKKKIDSPRSLKVMDNLEYKMEDIYYLTFPKFLEKFKEFKNLPEEFQRKKYAFYEECRQLKIKNINILRNMLIQNSKEGYNPNINENIDIKNMITKLKNIEAELENKILKNNDSQNIQKEKDDKKGKPIEKFKKLKQENLKKIKENEEDDKQEKLKEQKRLEEKAKKERELEIKRQKHKEQVEKTRKEFNDKISDKRKKMEEREKIRQEKNFVKKMEKMQLREIENRKTQERIERIKQNIEQQMEEQREKYEYKKLEERRRLQELENEKNYEQYQRIMKHRQREEYAKRILAFEEEKQEQKFDLYYKKQENIELKKEELRKINEYEEIERMEKIMQLKMRRLNAQENNYKIIEDKKFKTKQKIEKNSLNAKKILERKEQDNLKNIKLNQEKYNTVINEHKNLIQMDKKKREEMALLLQKKSEKIDNFIQNKINENQKSAMKKEIISNNRREFELEFKSLFHNKKLDENLVNKITEYFPNNNDLINIVEKIQNLEHEENKTKNKKRAQSSKVYNKRNENNKNKFYDINQNTKNTQYKQNIKNTQNIIIKNNINNNININDNNNIFISTINQNLNNDFNNQINNVYKEQDDKEILIKDALNEYKIELNKKLFDIIEQEENKEKERIILYNNTSINKKNDIMEEIKAERKSSNDLIQKIIEDNEYKLKLYEEQLRQKMQK